MRSVVASLARQLVDALRQHDATCATAESLTGGLLAATIVDVPGASTVFRGGVVPYATDLKSTLALVPRRLLQQHGPVHPTVAAAMARGVRQRCQADWGVATTGVAGPDAQDGHPVGEAYVAVDGPAGSTVEQLRATGSRIAIRRAAVAAALRLALAVL